MSSSDLVLVARDNGVTTVTMNRPEALNALSGPLRQCIAETFLELAEDEATQVIILTGAGRAFTVGLDLKELGGETASATVTDKDLGKAIANVGKPVIGAVNGFAITGGFEIALMCDFLIAGPNAKFADTHARVGVVPGWGLSQRLPRLIGINRAKELSLTGNYLDAATACDWGLVNRVSGDSDLMADAMAMATRLADGPMSLGLIRKAYWASWENDFNKQLQLESELQSQAQQSADSSEGVAAFLQKRPAEFKGR